MLPHLHPVAHPGDSLRCSSDESSFVAMPSRRVERYATSQQARGIVLILPFGGAQSWQTLSPNPIMGEGGLKVEELGMEDFRHWCDPCQKGFNSSAAYDAHLADHIWCTHPGCRFTCRSDKSWKMELHVASLHNRPDAPDLVDVEKYVSARKLRFPTTETVQCKVDELYFRAARGEVLPDERRRWLKQHGVFVSRNRRIPVMREGDELLLEVRKRQAERRKQQREEGAEGDDTLQQRRPVQPSAEKSMPSSTEEQPYQRRPGQKMLPLGPNGRYTNAQLVMMMRERYDAAHKAPAFYVCNRCGEKGHWVEACPKLQDESYTPQVKWGEGRLARPRPTEATLPNDGDEAPVELSARPEPEVEAAEEASLADSAMAPNAKALERMRLAKERSARRAATKEQEGNETTTRRRAQPVVRPPRQPTLYDRLTEDSRLNDMGLLLQAIRYFVKVGFLQRVDDVTANSADDSTTQVANPRSMRKLAFKPPTTPE